MRGTRTWKAYLFEFKASQPDLQSEFQGSQSCYTEKLCPEKTKKDKKGRGKGGISMIEKSFFFFLKEIDGHKVYEKSFNISNYQWGGKNQQGQGCNSDGNVYLERIKSPSWQCKLDITGHTHLESLHLERIIHKQSNPSLHSSR